MTNYLPSNNLTGTINSTFNTTPPTVISISSVYILLNLLMTTND